MQNQYKIGDRVYVLSTMVNSFRGQVRHRFTKYINSYGFVHMIDYEVDDPERPAQVIWIVPEKFNRIDPVSTMFQFKPRELVNIEFLNFVGPIESVKYRQYIKDLLANVFIELIEEKYHEAFDDPGDDLILSEFPTILHNGFCDISLEIEDILGFVIDYDSLEEMENSTLGGAVDILIECILSKK